MKLLIGILLAMSFTVHANECLELSKCIEHVSKLTGKKYLHDATNIIGGLQATSNFQITNENADTLISYILDLNGYARVPTAEKDTYLIVASKDIRYESIPVITVDASTPPTIHPSHDYYLMKYKFKHSTHGQIQEASNSLRPFMSRYSRIIEFKGTGIVTIQEKAEHLTRAYELIKSFDRELSKDEILDKEKREATALKMKNLECKEEPSKKTE